jgi:hypothetical protein
LGRVETRFSVIVAKICFPEAEGAKRFDIRHNHSYEIS